VRLRYLLLHAYGRGGTIRTTLATASALAERGHDVEVASVLRHARAPAFEVSDRVRLVPLTGFSPRRGGSVRPGNLVRFGTKVALKGTGSRLATAKDSRYAAFSRATDLWVRRYVQAQSGCVVIGTRAGLNTAVARLAAPDRVSVAQEHNTVLRAGAEQKQDYRRHFPRLDALVSLTERDAAAYRRLLGDQPRVDVLPNAVTGLEAAPLTTHEAKVVVSAGNLVHRKGFDLLIDAWRVVDAQHPDWELRIFGDGPLRHDLAAKVSEAGLRGRVRLMGPTDELRRELASASLFALSSRGEGMPMVLLEAMGCGLPAVSFDCQTGPAELIDDERTGVLVPPGRADLLGAALARAVSDAAGRRSMGTAARAAAEDYAMERIVTRWEQLFAELAAVRGVDVG